MPLQGASAFAGIAALLLLSACSGDDEDDGNSNDQGNVDFSESCMIPAVCGGDPTGSWDVAAGCVQPTTKDFECDWEKTAWGEVEGTMTLSAGSVSLDTDAELHHCGWIDGSSRSSGSSATVMGTTIMAGERTFEFCVEGDTLWLWDMAALSPDFSVLELARNDGG
jgi:hypothetical protein